MPCRSVHHVLQYSVIMHHARSQGLNATSINFSDCCTCIVKPFELWQSSVLISWLAPLLLTLVWRQHQANGSHVLHQSYALQVTNHPPAERRQHRYVSCKQCITVDWLTLLMALSAILALYGNTMRCTAMREFCAGAAKLVHAQDTLARAALQVLHVPPTSWPLGRSVHHSTQGVQLPPAGPACCVPSQTQW